MKLKHHIYTLMFVIMFIAMAAFPAMAAAAGSIVKDVRLWTAPDHTRLVFDLNQSITYKVFRLHKPERIVIDLQNTRLKINFNKLAIPDPVIKAIRHGVPETDVLRVVIDVKENVQPRSSLLKPMQDKPYRLVIDLMRLQEKQEAAITVEKSSQKKDIVVAVDAGHGGDDPGAIGPRKLREKDVTLAVAKKLAKIINSRAGMKAVLIRNGDYFVSLGKRIYLARQAKADMMISIHADAVRERSVEGASVYTLSERGATPDRAARALAAKENAADEVGGVGADEVYDSQVNEILSDMFRRDSLNSSQILAEEMLRKLKSTGPMKYSVPKRARFFVLKAMEIPSVLVELDYISNPDREKKLKNEKHQQKLAMALFDASIRFFEKMGRIQSTQSRRSDPQRSLNLHAVDAGLSVYSKQSSI